MIFGRLFKGTVQLIVLATNFFLLGCEASEIGGNEKIDSKFLYFVVLSEFAINTTGLISVTRDWGLRKNDFDGFPTSLQKYRFGVIQKLLDKHGIKSVSIERSTMSIEFNLFDSGVFGDSYLSLVYSKVPEKSTILTTPDAWSCKPYSVDDWYVCNGLNK